MESAAAAVMMSRKECLQVLQVDDNVTMVEACKLRIMEMLLFARMLHIPGLCVTLMTVSEEKRYLAQ